MNPRIKLFKNKWQVPWHLASAYIPAGLLLGAYAMPNRPFIGVHTALIYWLFATLSLGALGKMRLLTGGLGLMAILGVGIYDCFLCRNPGLALPVLLYGWLMLETLPIYNRDCQEELPPYVFILGIVLHLAGQAALGIARRNGNGIFEPVAPALTVGFIAYFVLTLLNLNRANLVFIASMEKSVPRHIYRYNRILTLLLVGITLFLSSLPAVVAWIQELWTNFIRLLGRVIGWVFSLIPDSSPIADNEYGVGRDPVLPGAESEPGLLARVLEIVLWTLILAAIAFFAYCAIRYISRLVRWLWRHLKAYAAAANAGDYVDEITDTREDGGAIKFHWPLRRKSNPYQGVHLSRLAPGERVRFYYFKLMQRHRDWRQSGTARENLPTPAAEIYERARYSQNAVSEGEARDFQDLVQDLLKN